MRVLVACGAALVQAEESLLSRGEHRFVRVGVAVDTVELEVTAGHLVADGRVVELLWIGNARLDEAAEVHDGERGAMVVGVTERALQGTIRIEDSMESRALFDLLCDLGVALETRVGQTRGESAVTLCAPVLAREFFEAAVDRTEGAGRSAVHVDHGDEEDPGAGEDQNPEFWGADSHPADPPNERDP